jgi:transposase
VERRQALEGAYVLKTNLPGRTHPLAEVLRAYKGRSRVDRRFHRLKRPPAVAPKFLKNPDRIAGLLCVLVWALMLLALMERRVRRELGVSPCTGCTRRAAPARPRPGRG